LINSKANRGGEQPACPSEVQDIFSINNVFIAAVKHKWTKSMELIYHLLDSPAELFANELLIFEYEKYAKTLGHVQAIDLSEDCRAD
jgi:hypothetical protein